MAVGPTRAQMRDVLGSQCTSSCPTVQGSHLLSYLAPFIIQNGQGSSRLFESQVTETEELDRY